MKQSLFTDFEYRKDNKLKKPVTPSKWTGYPAHMKITRLRLSCGGGMGGAQWFEYVRRYNDDTIPTNQIVTFQRYDGKDIQINTSFIVDAEEFTLAVVQLDISEWKNDTNSFNAHLEDTLQTIHVLLDKNTKLELLD